MDDLKYKISDFIHMIWNFLVDLPWGEIGAIVTIISTIIVLMKFFINRYRQRIRMKDLSDFITDEKIKHYLKYYIKTQCVDRPPEEEDEPMDNYEHANRQSLVKFFFNQVFTTKTKKVYLILGGAGMGKTTFLINLFYRYNSKSFKNKYKMKYISLSSEDADNFIEIYKKDGSDYQDGSNTILLLDGFDEDPKSILNYDERLNEIIKMTRSYRKMILTSRTHFFPEESKEKFSAKFPIDGEPVGYVTFIKKYIAPFSNKDISNYLKKRYGFKIKIFNRWFYQRRKRKNIEELVNMVSNLSVRPMLLDKIETIYKNNLSFNDENDIYEKLIEEWIKRESIKQPNNTSESFIEEMYDFINVSAINIYENFRNGKGLFINHNLIEEIAENNNVSLTKLDLTSRSLLNRNPKGNYKFSHKSILEYILSKIDNRNVVSTEFINFDSFDFGKKLRNKFLMNDLLSKEGLVYFEKFPEHFHQLTINDNILNIKSILFVTSDINDIYKLRIFENLKHIYLSQNIELFSKFKGKVIEITQNKKSGNSEDATYTIWTEKSFSMVKGLTINLNIDNSYKYFTDKNIYIFRIDEKIKKIK